jgi:hypothetical protein
MLRVLATLLATALLLVGALGAPAWAHPMPSSEVLLDVRASGVHAALTLPLTALALGWGRTLASDAAEVAREDGDALTGYVAAHVRASAPDGRPWSVLVHDVRSGGDPSDVYLSLEMTPPLGAPPDRLTLGYDVIFDRLVTHVAIVSVRDDFRHGLVGGSPLLLGTLRDTNPSMAIDCSGGSVWRGLAAMFRLGTQHIAEGTDHLLFLLALLLPASLRAIGGRWGSPLGVRAAVGRVVRVLTAFTVGHSATLALGVIGWVSVPAAIVEPAIALSIVAAALHALVPAFGEREAYLAGGFGLVHGLAFAATLRAFHFDGWTLTASLLGFNLGIEAFQIAAVALAMPWLLLLARTRAYPSIRVVGALATAVAASGWIVPK